MTPLLPTRELDDLESRVRATFHAVDAASPQAATRPVRTVGDAHPMLSRRHPTRRVLITGFAVAAAGTAVAAVVGTRSVTSPAEAAGQAALRRAARNAAGVPFVAPRSDQYIYSRTTSSFYADSNRTGLLANSVLPQPGTVSFPVSNVEETWEPIDPSRAGWTTTGLPTFLRPGDKDKARAAGMLRADGQLRSIYLESSQLGPNTFGDNFAAPSWPFLAALPSDPDVLYRRIESYSRGQGPSLDAEMLVTVGDALRSSLVPPSVAAAFYEVAARVPGVQLVANAVDLDGRRGVAVATAADGSRQEMIFDDSSGTFLGNRSVLTKQWQGHPVGTVIYSDATTVSFVDAIGDH